jgi:hypothetical protein
METMLVILQVLAGAAVFVAFCLVVGRGLAWLDRRSDRASQKHRPSWARESEPVDPYDFPDIDADDDD